MFEKCGTSGIFGGVRIFAPSNARSDIKALKKGAYGYVYPGTNSRVLEYNDSAYLLKGFLKTRSSSGIDFFGGSLNGYYIKSVTFCSSSTITSTIQNYSYIDAGILPNEVYLYYTGDTTNGYDIYLYNVANSGGVIYLTEGTNWFSCMGYHVGRM